MKLILTIVGALGLVFLSACSSSPPTGHAHPGRDAVPPSAQVDADIIGGEQSGLGGVVYSKARVTCERRVRTGTRIPRDICGANGFNGLFPSGINTGTAGESQPGYGRSQ